MVRRSAALLIALATCCAPSNTSVLALQIVASASSNAGDTAAVGATTANSTTTAATTSDLIGWFNCSALSFYDQFNIGSDFLPYGGYSYSSDANRLSTYAKRAQCAQYQAPLCHKGICEDAQARTIDVFVKRVLARDRPETKPNVWFFQGGPGFASPKMEYGMRALYVALEGDVNVYTMDHRGTGRSTPLNCIAAQATTSGSPFGAEIDFSEVAACAQELERTYGNDLSAFSITSAATDIASFIAKYHSGSKTFVYGVSYGSALVERLIHLNTTEIVGYILDGVATTSGAAASDGLYMSNADADFGEVADRFFDQLKSNAPTTATKFGSKTVKGVLASALATLDKRPTSRCATVFTTFFDAAGTAPVTTLPSQYVRQFLGKLFMSTGWREYIPVLIYRLNRCSASDAKVLAYALKAITARISKPSEEDALVSMLEYYLIVFSEMWESPTPSYDTLNARFANASIGSGNAAAILPLYCAFTHDASPACASYANVTATSESPRPAPLAYRKDKYWNVAATIPPQASVLVLSGKLDPQTPHKFAERLVDALNGTRKELVTFEYAPHGTLFSAVSGGKRISMSRVDFTRTPRRYCAVDILASFVSSGGNLRQLNRSCIAITDADMSVLDVDTLYSSTYLGTRGDDVFDGELYDYVSYSTKLKTPLIVVSVVAGILALGLLFYVCITLSNRRRAREAEQWRRALAHANAGVTASPTTATSFLPHSDGDATVAQSKVSADMRV